jgi:predicted GIY-YIG superfamily endonuclease
MSKTPFKQNLLFVDDHKITGNSITDHTCYIIKSKITGNIYIGYTINFSRRIRQHNGELTGGAKRTFKGRPWIPICTIKGFYDNTSALRFEYRLQKTKNKKNIPKMISDLIQSGDGTRYNKISWPTLYVKWFFNINCKIINNNVINYYYLTLRNN